MMGCLQLGCEPGLVEGLAGTHCVMLWTSPGLTAGKEEGGGGIWGLPRSLCKAEPCGNRGLRTQEGAFIPLSSLD